MISVNKIMWLLLALTLLGYSYQLSFQFQGQFAEGSVESLKTVGNATEGRTLILVDRRGFQLAEEIVPSLKFYFQHDVMMLANVNDLAGRLNQGFKDLASGYDSVLVLAQRELNDALPPLQKHETFRFRKGYYKESTDIPDDFRVHQLWVHLYKLNVDDYLADVYRPYVFKPRDSTNRIKNFTADYHWTRGCSEMELEPEVLTYETMLLSLRGWHPFWRDINRLGLKVSLNGEELIFRDVLDKGYLFELPSLTGKSKLQICSETFVPRELGINSDGRALGLDVLEIRLQ